MEFIRCGGEIKVGTDKSQRYNTEKYFEHIFLVTLIIRMTKSVRQFIDMLDERKRTDKSQNLVKEMFWRKYCPALLLRNFGQKVNLFKGV